MNFQRLLALYTEWSQVGGDDERRKRAGRCGLAGVVHARWPGIHDSRPVEERFFD